MQTQKLALIKIVSSILSSIILNCFIKFLFNLVIPYLLTIFTGDVPKAGLLIFSFKLISSLNKLLKLVLKVLIVM